MCAFAAGARTEHYRGLRVRRDEAASLPARAALAGHRVELTPPQPPVVPTDRAAIAVPMIGSDALGAVVYAASLQDRIANPDGVARTVAQAAAPYALASEREADRRSAIFDALTGLYGPRAFRLQLQEDVATARVRAGAALALWFVDTDRFKQINDTFGHATGDDVLQRMAALLREHTRPGIDIAARNGGDEFCAILRDVQKSVAVERAQRFCDAVRACDFGTGIPMSASIGVAAYPYDAGDASELLEAADAAMYHSKRSGRDRVSFRAGRGAFAVFS